MVIYREMSHLSTFISDQVISSEDIRGNGDVEDIVGPVEDLDWVLVVSIVAAEIDEPNL